MSLTPGTTSRSTSPRAVESAEPEHDRGAAPRDGHPRRRAAGTQHCDASSCLLDRTGSMSSTDHDARGGEGRPTSSMRRRHRSPSDRSAASTGRGVDNPGCPHLASAVAGRRRQATTISRRDRDVTAGNSCGHRHLRRSPWRTPSSIAGTATAFIILISDGDPTNRATTPIAIRVRRLRCHQAPAADLHHPLRRGDPPASPAASPRRSPPAHRPRPMGPQPPRHQTGSDSDAMNENTDGDNPSSPLTADMTTILSRSPRSTAC
jgi:hypothetical protein